MNTSLTQSVSPVFEGSIFYSAPELMNNDKVTYGCDIWALGCITYEMLKLKPPFDGDNPLTIAKNTCELNYERLNEKDIENKKLVQRLQELQKKYVKSEGKKEDEKEEENEEEEDNKEEEEEENEEEQEEEEDN